MSRPDLLGHLMEWLPTGPLPTEESEHGPEEPPADGQPDASGPTERDGPVWAKGSGTHQPPRRAGRGLADRGANMPGYGVNANAFVTRFWTHRTHRTPLTAQNVAGIWAHVAVRN